MGFSRQECLSGFPCPPPGEFSQRGLRPRSPTLQVDYLPSVPPGKPPNTKMGSLSLLQGIFPTQKSNWGLLHCRQILYQLSYQGSPYNMVDVCTGCHGSISESNFIPLGEIVTDLTEERIPQPRLQGEVLFICANSMNGTGEME